MENDKNGLQLEIKPDIAKGNYSNLALIVHSHSEFIIDFATMLPGTIVRYGTVVEAEIEQEVS